MINYKNIILGHGDLRISSMRFNGNGAVAIKEQSKHNVWDRVDNPRTAEECIAQGDINIIITDVGGAEVLVSKLLEAMLYGQNKDDVAELVKSNEITKDGKSDFKKILSDFDKFYSYDSTCDR